MAQATTITKQILRHYGTLSESEKGWTKELNLVSWNGRDPKYDIREWSPDKFKTGKGVTIKQQEIVKLKRILGALDLPDENTMKKIASEIKNPAPEVEAATAVVTASVAPASPVIPVVPVAPVVPIEPAVPIAPVKEEEVPVSERQVEVLAVSQATEPEEQEVSAEALEVPRACEDSE